MILSIFILFVTSKLVRSQISPCPNGVLEFNVSLNESTFSYPNGFNKTVEPPLFPLNYTCEYQINVPPKLYAKIELVLETNSTENVAPVTVIDQLNRTEKVFYANYEAFFFIASGGKIKLSTGNSFVKFGFIVKRYQFETLPVAYQFNVSQADTQPTVLYVTPSSNIPYLAMAETRVSVMVQPLRPNIEVLRALLVFDGLSWNSSSLGTGMQLYRSGSQYVSTGSYMTIMYLDQDFDNAYFGVVVQDYELTKDLVQIQQRNGMEHQKRVTYALDGSLGPSALFSINTDVLMKLEGSGKLEAYLGTITKDKSNMVASYTVNDSSLYLPQEFLGNIKTYVLTGGVANLTFSSNQEQFKTTHIDGRKGFISSYEYGTFGNYLDVSKEIYAPNKTLSIFKFNFSTLDLKGNNTLTVQGIVDEDVVVFKTMDPKQESTPPTKPAIEISYIRNILVFLSILGIFVSLSLMNRQTNEIRVVGLILILINSVLLLYGSFRYDIKVLRSSQDVTLLMMALVTFQFVFDFILFVSGIMHDNGAIHVNSQYFFWKQICNLLIGGALCGIYFLIDQFRLHAIHNFPVYIMIAKYLWKLPDVADH